VYIYTPAKSRKISIAVTQLIKQFCRFLQLISRPGFVVARMLPNLDPMARGNLAWALAWKAAVEHMSNSHLHTVVHHEKENEGNTSLCEYISE